MKSGIYTKNDVVDGIGLFFIFLISLLCLIIFASGGGKLIAFHVSPRV